MQHYALFCDIAKANMYKNINICFTVSMTNYENVFKTIKPSHKTKVVVNCKTDKQTFYFILKTFMYIHA